LGDPRGLDYTTTSDWTTLELKNPAGVLTARLMSTRGEPVRAAAGVSSLALGQPLAAAQAGGSVGLTAHYAVAAESVGQPFQFLLQKGSLNGSIVRVSVLVGDEPRLLREVSHQIVVGTEGRNPLEFAVDLSSVKAIPPRQAPVALPGGQQRMLWAFYYPWYYANSWSSAVLKDRPAFPYASDDAHVIARHVSEAQAAGIDGFVSSWWGPTDYTDRNLRALLEAARERDFAVTIYFETLTGDPPRGRQSEEIFQWLSYVIATYREHPAFMKIDGKPLIFIWASDAAPLASWRDVFEKLRARGLDGVFLAMGRSVGDLSVFDGLHEYGPPLPDSAPSPAPFGRAVRYYHLLADSAAPKIWAPAIQPGYDDRLIPGRAGSFRDRLDGAFYRATFDAALRTEPDWLGVCTWNEWPEHTYIEASQLYGDQYLRITRELAEKWKGKTIRRVANAASCQAGPVAPGEIVTLFGLGLGPEKLATLELDSTGRVATRLAATRVLLDDQPAPLLFACTSQTSAVAPYVLAGQSSARVRVEYAGVKSNELVVPLSTAAPGVFTADSSGKGPGAILNQDQSLNTVYRPAARGSVVTMFATGEGQTRPEGVDGQVAVGALPRPVSPVSATIGGLPAEVLYAGAAPGLVAGVLQVNLKIPEALAPGLAVPVVLTVGNVKSPEVTLAVEHALAGAFEAADSAGCQVRGWVRRSDSTAPVEIQVYRDGVIGSGISLGRVRADTARPDLPFADTSHGFACRFGSTSGLLEDREHAIYIYSLDGRGAPLALLNGSPKTLRCGANGASFVTQSVPATMKAGARLAVSVGMRNAGTRAWLPVAQGGHHKLGAQAPQDSQTWGTTRVNLPRAVALGETVTISFTVTAPAQAGTYSFQWRMVEELVEWFGDATPLTRVVVEP